MQQETLLDIMQAFEDKIHDTNMALLDEIKKEENLLSSVQNIKISFSEKILEDLVFLVSVEKNVSYKKRYGNILLRSISEQIIECIYLLKHPEEIDGYLGMDINLDSLNSIIMKNESKNSILLRKKKLGELRYKTGGRKCVKRMADAIKESSSEGENARLSLYDIYQILSDKMHNAYYKSILDEVAQIEKPAEYSERFDFFQIMLLNMMLEAFWEAYSSNL